MYCICCNKRVTSFDYDPWGKVDDAYHTDVVIDTLSVGYGTSYDGDILKIAICISCLNEKIQEGTILLTGNYIVYQQDQHFIDKEIEKSKKYYLRRKNIDNLLE